MSSRRSHLVLVWPHRARARGHGAARRPRLAVHRGVKKGLDLQGGLEVVLKAQPPPGHKLTSADLDRVGLDHAQPRRQARRRVAGDPQAGHRPDRDPARRRPQPGAGGGDHRQHRRSSSCTTSSRRSCRRRSRSAAAAGRDAEPLPAALARRRPPRRTASRAATSSSSPSRSRPRPATARRRRRRRRSSGSRRPARSPRCTATRRPGNAGLLDASKGQDAEGLQGAAGPAGTIVITCSAEDDRRLPGRPQRAAAAGQDRLLPLQARRLPERPERPVPEPDGQGAEALRHAPGLRPDDRLAGRADAVHDKGNKAFYKVTRNEGLRGPDPKAPQHFAIVLDNEIRSWPQIDYNDRR